jgi:hypothetical protein
MSESINKLKELVSLLQDPNCDVNVVTLGIADLLDTLPKLLAVVEAADRLITAVEFGDDTTQVSRKEELEDALAALEEEV